MLLNITSHIGLYLPGITPLHKPYKYVPTQREWFLRLFDLKAGILTFAHFGLESGMVFEGNMGVYSEICEFEMDFKKSLCLRFNLSNHDIISA